MRYLFLSAADTSHAAVRADEASAKACGDATLLCLGGPMLGAVTPQGARVWMRTCRPGTTRSP